MYDRVDQMEPMLPEKLRQQLESSALELIRESSALASLLREPTRHELVDLLRSINSYYSNLIEGHGTRPFDIERALRNELDIDPKRRQLQLESRAHVLVQRDVEMRLESEPTLDIFSADFLRWVHTRFYDAMPSELREVESNGLSATIIPGEFRKSNVRVGRHIPPLHEHLAAFLSRFQEAYSSRVLTSMQQIVASAASHHRLAWIHPFLDGNGRVVRLFTDACLKRLRLDGHGLWTVSRGLARKRDEYFRYLEAADEPRRGDLDGRGSLSDAGLAEFCSFFLETCLDQVRFMRELLNLGGLESRITGFAELSAARRELPIEAGYLLRDILLRGEVPRGETGRISGQSERNARRMVATLLERGLLRSSSEKSALRLGFPTHVVPYYFPRLYPAHLEDDMRHGR